MGDYLRAAKRPTARKPHQCIACFGPIEAGERYVTQSGFFDDRAFFNRFHAECFSTLCEEGEGEFTPGTFDVPERIAARANQGESK